MMVEVVRRYFSDGRYCYCECQLMFDADPKAIARAARGIAFVELVGAA